MDGRSFSLFTEQRHVTKSDLATCEDKSQPGWLLSLSHWERDSGGWQSVGGSTCMGLAGAKWESRRRTWRKENRRKAIKIPWLSQCGSQVPCFERTNVFVSPQQVRRKTDGRLLKQEGREVMNLTANKKKTDSMCSSEDRIKHPGTLGIWRDLYFPNSFRWNHWHMMQSWDSPKLSLFTLFL
jgi:hypothetical protein